MGIADYMRDHTHGYCDIEGHYYDDRRYYPNGRFGGRVMKDEDSLTDIAHNIPADNLDERETTQSLDCESCMESTKTKLWKVVVEISHSRSDGNGESRRDIKTRYFDDFESAEHFADRGDIEPNNFFAQVVSRHIYEYDVRSVRELERKKHEITREVKDITWIWE